MGGSKSFKTWAQMDIAYCVANGLPWWGTHTEQYPVVYLDFELLDYDYRWRMEQIAKAHGKGDIDAVKRIGLRCKTVQDNHWPIIHELILAEGAGLVCCDPTYKLLGGRDECNAGHIAEVTAMFDRVTEATGAALIFAQHFSKGNQADKESIDRGAGSGVWSRDADSIMVMTKHTEEECLTIETTVRSFPRIEPFVVRWSQPLFIRDGKLDPTDLKKPHTGGAVAKYHVSDLVDCLNGDNLSTGEFQKLVHSETGMPPSTFYRLLKEAAEQNQLNKSKVDSKWEKIIKKAK